MPVSSDLEALLAQCLRREPAAQRALYARYAGRMLGVARRYAYTLPEAEDILQDAFVKVFIRLGEFRSEGSLEGWIRRIVVTTAINHWQSGKLRRQSQVEFPDTQDFVPAVSASALDQLNVREVLSLIEQLPEGCKVVLLLYAVDGYSHSEISELLGIKESTSKAQLSKARKQLLHLYQQQNNYIRL
ncbi:RNA polymerase sigma factor [Hymenobacter psychrotolerans]|uniref:RNA polymerase sigma-70 factor, ECF subfamily n=1 Tax=Hymenobacter psychrotolerans DSM 18569 TaxID=1121959 RepID=A0A1M6ZAY2_9BACT|nr:RNA polymerase sigma factor [Hymenobacter psychrotolerans]SHL27549.1 RNA polymerase sigma-70 factor, ECF subfamily [Hymenobacter psychrotolerans DSM 18569]